MKGKRQLVPKELREGSWRRRVVVMEVCSLVQSERSAAAAAIVTFLHHRPSP